MTQPESKNIWSEGEGYEPYVGRWSRLVAREFVAWLAMPAGLRWLDVGCGTGALSQTILSQADPVAVQGIDHSEGFLAVAKRQVDDPRAQFTLGKAAQLPVGTGEFDIAVSGLVLNFVPDAAGAVQEMRRAIKPGGTIAAYVWDYSDKMEMMRYYWDAAVTLRPEDRHLTEGIRFTLCNPEPLQALFEQNDMHQVNVRAIDIATHFRDFDDYWQPFLIGRFPAPSYNMGLSEEDRAALREHLRATLPTHADGSIPLTARAWAVRGVV